MVGVVYWVYVWVLFSDVGYSQVRVVVAGGLMACE